MKRENLRVIALLGLFAAVLAVSPARAQSVNEQRADIPFAFNIGDRSFPAGHYRVTRINQASDITVLAIKSSDGRLSKLTLTTRVENTGWREPNRLVFNRYGDQYFLSSVRRSAGEDGLELPLSGAERALQRSPQMLVRERQTVALVQRLRQ